MFNLLGPESGCILRDSYTSGFLENQFKKGPAPPHGFSLSCVGPYHHPLGKMPRKGKPIVSGEAIGVGNPDAVPKMPNEKSVSHFSRCFGSYLASCVVTGLRTPLPWQNQRVQSVHTHIGPYRTWKAPCLFPPPFWDCTTLFGKSRLWERGLRAGGVCRLRQGVRSGVGTGMVCHMEPIVKIKRTASSQFLEQYVLCCVVCLFICVLGGKNAKPRFGAAGFCNRFWVCGSIHFFGWLIFSGCRWLMLFCHFSGELNLSWNRRSLVAVLDRIDTKKDLSPILSILSASKS